MEMESFHGLSWMPQQNNSSALNSFSCSFNENDLKARRKKKKKIPLLFTPPTGHQYSGMQLCLVWKCKSPFVAIIYGLRRLSRVLSVLVHYYTITVHGLLTPLSALTGFLKGYATSLPYQCGGGPANVLISHLVPFHSKRRPIAQFQKKGGTSNTNSYWPEREIILNMERLSDFLSLALESGGRFVAVLIGLNSSLWFTHLWDAGKETKLTGFQLLFCVCIVASSSVVPIPGTFSWPLAARGKPRRGMLRRAVFSDVQRKALEKMFQKQKYISKPDRKKLASKLGLKDSQVKCSQIL